MTLAEHERRLIEDKEYCRQWVDEEVRSSSDWFVQQLSTKQKDTECVTKCCVNTTEWRANNV